MSRDVSVDSFTKAHVGVDVSNEAAEVEFTDTASVLTAGHVGSCFMTNVTCVGKVTVSVNKEMSAAVGESAI